MLAARRHNLPIIAFANSFLWWPLSSSLPLIRIIHIGNKAVNSTVKLVKNLIVTGFATDLEGSGGGGTYEKLSRFGKGGKEEMLIIQGALTPNIDQTQKRNCTNLRFLRPSVAPNIPMRDGETSGWFNVCEEAETNMYNTAAHRFLHFSWIWKLLDWFSFVCFVGHWLFCVIRNGTVICLPPWCLNLCPFRLCG